MLSKILAAAARGEANEQWHTLLSVVGAQPIGSGEVHQQTRHAVSSVSTYGEAKGHQYAGRIRG